jgi:hypothetical protein
MKKIRTGRYLPVLKKRIIYVSNDASEILLSLST